MQRNIIDKIWEAHVVERSGNSPDVFFVDLQLVHEVTSPQAFAMLEKEGKKLAFPHRHRATIDHSIPTDEKRQNWGDKKSKAQVMQLQNNCKNFGIDLYSCGSGNQGIVHVMGPELGLTQPGRTMVCGDSHTSTHGAFGALAFGIGTTQISHVMATQALLLEKPKTMRVEFVGIPSPYFSAKDAMLLLIQQIGIQGGTGYSIEFCGDFIENLSMEGRMTICNMSIECGAKLGVVSPDEKTFDYLKNREFVREDLRTQRQISWEEKIEGWKQWASDTAAGYDKQIVVDIAGKSPVVTWGTNPEQSICISKKVPNPTDFSDTAKALACEKALNYIKIEAGKPLTGTKIDYVFVGSCTNARIEDFRVVAQILQGKKIADHVTAYFVPGSEKVRAQCVEEGLDKIFTEAGADFRQSGCSMCLAMNGDKVPVGKRCASTSNRNFVGRQGVGSYTHLMSPLMAALCAVEGKITDPEGYFS
jgi:3-isopropylmalate/(R)-2-methylmalate dehydratase large subunit